MYIYPVQFPQFSNREDFLSTVALFDDDLGTAISLSGTTLAIPGAAFTSNAWTIIDGAIVTNSATSITIPNFPIGGQLLALALTVGLNLGILAGDPITIQDTATGKNQMVGYVLSYAAATGALVVQIGMAFEFEIRRWRRPGHGGGYSDGYSTSNNIGVYDTGEGPIISAQLGNGLTIIDIGYLQILIPVSVFGKLHERTYLAALTMTDSVNTRQIFVGELPVQYGGVTRGALPNQTPAAWANTF
jgi:hypothetical protein